MTIQNRYHKTLIAQRENAWRKAMQTGRWQDWREHSEIHARLMESQAVNRATHNAL
jgi:hypothetical protein